VAPPAPSRQAARARTALLRAAREVFEAKGYANARVEDITDAAQYAVGSFYTYFESKEDAFREVMGQLGTDVAARPPGQDASGDSPAAHDLRSLERRIQHANQRYYRAFTAEGRLWAVVEEAALRHPGPRAMIRDRWRRYWDATAAALAPWRDAGVIGPDVDVLGTVTALSAMTEWIISLRRGYGFTAPRPIAIPDLTPVWLRALGAGRRPPAPGSRAAGPAPGVAPAPGPAPAAGAAPASGVAPIPVTDLVGSQPDASPDEAAPATTRERLIAAGRTELSRRGIGDVPISDIAGTAGVSVGSFYTYFPSKSDLVAALLDESPGLLYATPADVLAGAGERVEAGDDVAGAALALIRAHLAAVAANEGLWRSVVEAALTEPLIRAVVNEQRQAWMLALAALFARWQATGAVDAGLDVDLAGGCLGALTERTTHLWVVLGDAPPADEGAIQLRDCWWRLLAPAP